MSKYIKAEVATLELPLTEVTPLRKGDRITLAVTHRQGIPVDNVLRQHMGSRSMEIIRRRDIQVVGKHFQHVRAAFSNVVLQEFDPVSAHQGE